MPVKRRNPTPSRLIKGPIRGRSSQRELKYIDTYISELFLDGAAPVVPLNLVAEGDDNTNRNGRLINCISLEVRGTITSTTGGSTGVEDNVVRCVLVWDNAPNGAALVTAADIFTVISPSIVPTSESLPLVDRSSRFSILSDDSIALGFVVSGAVSSPTSAAYHKYIRLNAATKFSGTGALITAIQNGAVYMVFMSDIVPTVTSDSYRFEGMSRIRFSDM